MRILSWNVQSGKSCDGSADFSRTLEHIKSLGDFDVICLQELARNMTAYAIPGQSDHLLMAQQFFKHYNVTWGTGFSWPSEAADPALRQEFGNISLVRPELLDFRVHQLPRPSAAGNKQMQRVAVETVIASRIGPVSIINTHLAFHDDNENRQQIEHLNRLEQERKAQHLEPKQIGSGIYREGFLASARMLCGDFNFTPASSQYCFQIENSWVDAWRLCNGDERHAPTCGIFDAIQWRQGAHCRDYFWLSHELRAREVDISVDVGTSLSDHQPIILEVSI